MFWQFFLQCSFSLWKIFVLREIEVCISCGDADKANFVPEAFKLWGGKKEKKRGKSSCNSSPCGTQCCRAHVKAAYEESDLSFNGNTARKPNKG